MSHHILVVDNEPDITAGTDIELAVTDRKLLVTLAERRGRVQSRAQLLQNVWEASPEMQTQTVNMLVQRLRTKLGPAADWIQTARAFGYRFGTSEGTRKGRNR